MLSTLLEKFWGIEPVTPPIAQPMKECAQHDPDTVPAALPDITQPQPISAFACIIEYMNENRFITCRRYDLIGQNAYVGAICHTAGGYRQFRCDRITSVVDAYSGEILGNGDYFARFVVTSAREPAPSWGLSSGRKSLLVAGLNILAFMARCDGNWHPLETQPIENFVCALWLRKEWEGEPPIQEIMAHTQRLTPDSDTFFRALNYYASNRLTRNLLRRAVGELIAADGLICDDEHDWATELEQALSELAEAEIPGEDLNDWIEREMG